jgi:3-hydroxy acid dehydrogenase/malonic semialdehyde reductase
VARHALIFGHSSGLGRAICKSLLDENYKVTGIARSESGITAGGLTEISADLSLPHETQRAVDQVKSDYSDFGVLVYAAGALTAQDIDKLNYDDLTHIYQINLFAPMMIESALFGLISRNGAYVINITSSAIHDYYPKFAIYSSAKAAFAKFTDDLRRELTNTRARVLEMCPSGFTSRMYKHMRGEKIDRDESLQIRAEDLAELVTYVLRSPQVMEPSRLYVNRKPKS